MIKTILEYIFFVIFCKKLKISFEKMTQKRYILKRQKCSWRRYDKFGGGGRGGGVLMGGACMTSVTSLIAVCTYEYTHKHVENRYTFSMQRYGRGEFVVSWSELVVCWWVRGELVVRWWWVGGALVVSWWWVGGELVVS